MESKIQFAPVLDEIFTELEASARFEIHCNTTVDRQSQFNWPPVLKVASVNGSKSLREYTAAMADIYLKSVTCYLEALRKLDPIEKPHFLNAAYTEAQKFVEDYLPLVDVFTKEAKNNTLSACTFLFGKATCFVDGTETRDPLMILQALTKTNLYARVWYKLVTSVKDLLISSQLSWYTAYHLSCGK